MSWDCLHRLRELDFYGATGIKLSKRLRLSLASLTQQVRLGPRPDLCEHADADYEQRWHDIYGRSTHPRRTSARNSFVVYPWVQVRYQGYEAPATNSSSSPGKIAGPSVGGGR